MKNQDIYMDAAEYRISIFVKDIENFIKSYGYKKPIISINEDFSLRDIESKLVNFFKENNKNVDEITIYGTLKESNCDTYVCCYEPYGDEVFCVKSYNNHLYFYNTADTYETGIKVSNINYIF